MAGALQLCDLLSLRDQPTVLRQSVPEHVGEQHHVHFLADLAHSGGGFAEILRRTDEFGVRVAHGVAVHATSLELVDQCATRESVVDHTDITAQHVNGESHGFTRYF